MILTIVWNGSYFRKLSHVVKNIQKRKVNLVILILLSIGGLNAQTHTHEDGTVHDFRKIAYLVCKTKSINQLNMSQLQILKQYK